MKIKVGFLFDIKNNWIENFINNFKFLKKNYNFNKTYILKDLKKFDIVFILSYTKVISYKYFNNKSLYLVIHSSSLPKGRGFSPMQWQVQNNRSSIKNSMIIAKKKVDEGDIVLQNTFKIDKTDLYKDLRKKQAKSICELINKFLKIYPNYTKKKQIGEVSYYRKRNINDNKLNLNQSLKSNFRILRLSDNEKFPSWFFYKGKKFIIKIYKE